ncbi:MAG: S-layer homology domain-containing protein [Niameybacter sp.]
MKLPRSTVEAYINNPDHWAFASMASVGSKLNETTLQAIAALGEEALTRELLAQVIYEVTEGQLKTTQTSMAFSDMAQSPYQEALIYCAQAGVLNGVEEDKMCPEKALTRAEFMTVLVRLDALLK